MIATFNRGLSLGRNEPARGQVLEMSENRQACRLYQSRIEPDVDAPYESGDVGLAPGQAPQDCSLATLAVTNVVPHKARRLAHEAAVTGQVYRFRPTRELLQRGHVITHSSVRRGDDRRGPR